MLEHIQTYFPPDSCNSPPGQRWTGTACWPLVWTALWRVPPAALWHGLRSDGVPLWSPADKTASR